MTAPVVRSNYPVNNMQAQDKVPVSPLTRTRTSEYNIKTGMLVFGVACGLLGKLSYETVMDCNRYFAVVPPFCASPWPTIHKIGAVFFTAAAVGFTTSFVKGLIGHKINRTQNRNDHE